MDNFNKEKGDFLSKKDKSKKGKLDKDIISLVGLINSFDGYYTTSSCAGRIVLIEIGKRKDQCSWLFAKHSKVSPKEIISALKESKSKNPIWLRQQPVIMHIACSNMEKAKMMLDKCRQVLKRSGIISATPRKTVIEIIGSEHLETIVKDKDFIADDDYIFNLVKYANKNFTENKKKINALLILLQNNANSPLGLTAP